MQDAIPGMHVAFFCRSAGRARNGMLAVCLTGQLRWFELTLATLKHLVLGRLTSPHRVFFVGPAGDGPFEPAEQALTALGAEPADICAYDPNLTWAWGPGAMGRPIGPFDMHGSDICTRRLRPHDRRITFDMRFLPVFRRCIAQRKGSETWIPLPPNMGDDERGEQGRCRACDKYNFTRAQPCWSAASLVLQLWQSMQSLTLVRAAERRTNSVHSAILRMRPDIFFFKPVVLPTPPVGVADWYSMFEESCKIHEGVSESTYGLGHRRFLQDFWLYGSRSAMEVAMEEPLRRLLEFGVDASAFQACAACQVKPLSITVRGKRRESCCNRDKKSRRSTPKYAMHPVPEVLNRTFNASSQCLKFFDTYGLIRVNPRDSCFMVQARLPDPRSRLRRARGVAQREVKPWESLHDERGLKWRQVDLLRSRASSNRNGVVKPEHRNTPMLDGLVELYQRCFGLVANASCPRTVGDRKLFSGPEAACLRSPTAPCGEAHGGLVRRKPSGFGGDGASAQTGFACVSEGLAKLLAK